jgi:hypothetical protein
MHEREKNDLLRLEPFDRWLVIAYWRWLLLRQNFGRMPLPGRLAVVDSVVLGSILFSGPDPKALRAMFVPVVWMGSFALSLMICMLLPSRKRRAHIHWV